MEFKNLQDLILKFQDESVCRKHLAEKRWNGKPVCPKCKGDKVYNIEGGARYKCGNKECYHKFSVTSGTYMENSKIPLTIWFPALYLVTAHKKGISSIQLAKDLSVTQKTAWFMLQRIREALKDDKTVLGNIIEADETNIGGKISNKHNKERADWANSKDKLANKSSVFAMVERNGLVVTKHVDSATKKDIYPVIKERVIPNSIVVTDTAQVYAKLNSIVFNPQVNHGNNEYVRDDWYTNTIEGFFSQLKRSIYGVYHKVSHKHLQRYCDETSYRYNTRDLSDPKRFTLALSNFEGRLTYRSLVDNDRDKPVRKKQDYKKKGYNADAIKQMLNGEVVATFRSARQAWTITGISKGNIHSVLKGDRKTAGGFEWIYA